MNAFRRLFMVGRISPIANGVIIVQIHMIDAAIVRGQRRDHLVLLLPSLLLFQQFLLQGETVFQFLLLCPLAFLQFRVRFFQFFSGDFLVLNLSFGTLCVTDKEKDDQCGDSKDDASEDCHVFSEHIGK